MRICFILFALVFCNISAKATETPRINIAPHVREAMNILVQSENEAVLYLTGTHDGNRFTVTGYERPHTWRAGPYSATVSPPRNRDGVIGWWHTHPWGMCNFGPTDQRTATALQLPLAMVQTAPDRFCFWTLQQIQKFQKENGVKTMMLDLPGQMILKGNPK